jgi:DNA-binding NarL/FixJ family response regulator
MRKQASHGQTTQGPHSTIHAPLAAALRSDKPRIIIISNVRLYREGVGLSLARNDTTELLATGDSDQAYSLIGELRPDVILLDSLLIDASALPRRMREIAPQLKIVAFAVSQDDRDVVACAVAGISAYVSCDGSAEDLIVAVHQAMRGEFVCPPRITALLLGHLAAISAGRSASASVLTQREMEIVPLVEQGLSNKEIARQLRVGTATVKNHIHNILEKLQLRRRGEVGAHLRREGAAPSPRKPGGGGDADGISPHHMN